MSKQRTEVLRKTVEILVKSFIAVGILELIGNLINWEKLAGMKKVIFSRNK